jgi:hypothetical protein
MAKIIYIFLLLVVSIYAKSRSELSSALSYANGQVHKKSKELNNANNELNNLKSNMNNKQLVIPDNFEVIAYDKNNKYIGTLEYNLNFLNSIGVKFQIYPKSVIPSNHVIFYSDIDYTGLFISLPIGDYFTNNISLPKKTISSVKIPEGVNVLMYCDDNFDSDYIILSKDQNNLASFNFNDKTVAIRIIPLINHEDDFRSKITIFEKSDYSGIKQNVNETSEITLKYFNSIKIRNNNSLLIYYKSTLIKVITKDTPLININCNLRNKICTQVFTFKIIDGTFPILELYENIDFKGPQVSSINYHGNYESDLFNINSISSIKISQDYEIQLYEYKNFTGYTVILTGDVSDLRQYAFNDLMNSYKIRLKSNTEDKIELKYESQIQYLPIGTHYCNTFNQQIFNWCDNQIFMIIKFKIPNNILVQVTNSGYLWSDTINITNDSIIELMRFDYITVSYK